MGYTKLNEKELSSRAASFFKDNPTAKTCYVTEDGFVFKSDNKSHGEAYVSNKSLELKSFTKPTKTKK